MTAWFQCIHGSVAPSRRVFLLTRRRRARAAQSNAERSEAQALQVAGVHLMDQGDEQGALAKFEEAFRLFPSPKILFNMGRAHLALARGGRGAHRLRAVLDEAPYAPKESRAEAERASRSSARALVPRARDRGQRQQDQRRRTRDRHSAAGPAGGVMPGAHEVRVEKTGLHRRDPDRLAGPGTEAARLREAVAPPAPAPAPPCMVTTAAPSPPPRASQTATNTAPEAVSTTREPQDVPGSSPLPGFQREPASRSWQPGSRPRSSLIEERPVQRGDRCAHWPPRAVHAGAARRRRRRLSRAALAGQDPADPGHRRLRRLGRRAGRSAHLLSEHPFPCRRRAGRRLGLLAVGRRAWPRLCSDPALLVSGGRHHRTQRTLSVLVVALSFGLPK